MSSPEVHMSSQAVSRLVMPSVDSPAISRPATPTLPSFSQSANVINITFNNYGVKGEAGEF